LPAVDVVVIGGGIIGSASAYELARRGLRCIVVERNGTAGSEASGAAAGILGAQTEPPAPPFFDLLVEGHRRSLPLTRRLREETGMELELVLSPGIQLLFSDDEARRAAKVVAAHRGKGLEAQVLSPSEVREREPSLSLKGVKAALLLGGEHHLSAPSATQAIARAAELRGARFFFDAEVKAIDRPARHRFSVRTSAGDFESPWVVNAAGAWAGAVAAMVGLRVPVEPVRGQIYMTVPRPPFLRSVVLGDKVYALQRLAGNVLIGATYERVVFDKRVVPETIADLHAHAGTMIPSLSGVAAVQSWAGLRPGTPDDHPILDAPPRVPGFVLATGHFRNGILLAPLTGEIVAALVSGEKPPVPLKPWALDRFGH